MDIQIINTKIEGVNIVETSSLKDERGEFSRWFCKKELQSILGNKNIVQINHSRTLIAGTVRGMHFQKKPHAETKLIRCIRGRVWDVALDLRTGSPTFLQWHAEELSMDNNRMMTVPEGCAHGFQALEAQSEMLYLHTEFYTPKSEGGVLYSDSLVGIKWPLPVTDLSERDKSHPLLSSNFQGF